MCARNSCLALMSFLRVLMMVKSVAAAMVGSKSAIFVRVRNIFKLTVLKPYVIVTTRKGNLLMIVRERLESRIVWTKTALKQMQILPPGREDALGALLGTLWTWARSRGGPPSGRLL